MNNEELWDNFLEVLSSKLNGISFNTWFKDSKLVNIVNNNIIIQLGNQYKKNYIENYYTDLIEEVLEIVTNENFTFELVTEEDLKKDNVVNDVPDLVQNQELPRFKDTVSNLNQKYTFENFIVGDTNRFAQTVALSVAEQPGKLYNPLFIYGKSGLGKTHLMHAIGNFIKENSNKSVLYVRSEEFINDFVQTYRKGEDNIDLKDHFNDKYRNIDVLIIDDIQLFRTASQSQTEFFNTFNCLHDKGKQIVISSDSSPDDMKYLEDRLKTRFAWGLQANIMPPDYELKVNILKNKMAGTEVSSIIKPEVLDYIANNCENDVRHLEGIVNRLLILTSMYLPKEINLEFAQENLKDYFGSSLYITNSVAKVQKAVAEYFNLTVENLKSKKRTADINNARQIAMYICKMTTEETIERIGLEFNRNHATVIHACDKIEEEMKNSDSLKSQIIEIKAKINN